MRAPLVELREKIEQFRGSVDVSLVAIENGLKQRSEAASARETLELLLDTFHVVSKVTIVIFYLSCLTVILITNYSSLNRIGDFFDIRSNDILLI